MSQNYSEDAGITINLFLRFCGKLWQEHILVTIFPGWPCLGGAAFLSSREPYLKQFKIVLSCSRVKNLTCLFKHWVRSHGFDTGGVWYPSAAIWLVLQPGHPLKGEIGQGPLTHPHSSDPWVFSLKAFPLKRQESSHQIPCLVICLGLNGRGGVGFTVKQERQPASPSAAVRWNFPLELRCLSRLLSNTVLVPC